MTTAHDLAVLSHPRRLQQLYESELLDTAPEESFDRVTWLVSSMVDAPVALVSLVDRDRQFFKSSIGLAEPWATRRETPLSHSFCQHVVGSGRPLIVEDARTDALVLDNLAIRDLGVIAYAGYPLTTKEGSTLGSLCAIDTEPREWSGRELAIVRELAASVVTEIELRAQLRLVLEKENRLLELGAAVASSADAILGYRLDGTIHSWNAGAEQMYGYSADEVLGKPIAALIPAGIDGEARMILEVVRSGKAIRDLETKRLRKDGSSLPVSITISPVRSSDGEIVGASAIARDLTERYEMERRKDEMVAVIAHELRTPLTSIRGSLGMLATGKLGTLSGSGQRMLEIALHNSERLTKLLDDFLETERLASGEIQLEKRELGVDELLGDAMKALEGYADKHQVRLVARECPLTVIADPERIHQVLANLMSNAIKFSPAGGGVEIAAAGEGGAVIFRVTDQGRGIPDGKIRKIFERFEQVDSSDRRDKGGSGLGLAIARAIVEQHEGRIWVESELGVGTTFFFSLPAGDVSGG